LPAAVAFNAFKQSGIDKAIDGLMRGEDLDTAMGHVTIEANKLTAFGAQFLALGVAKRFVGSLPVYRGKAASITIL
jgi:hypothetical protein